MRRPRARQLRPGPPPGSFPPAARTRGPRLALTLLALVLASIGAAAAAWPAGAAPALPPPPPGGITIVPSSTSSLAKIPTTTATRPPAPVTTAVPTVPTSAAVPPSSERPATPTSTARVPPPTPTVRLAVPTTAVAGPGYVAADDPGGPEIAPAAIETSDTTMRRPLGVAAAAQPIIQTIAPRLGGYAFPLGLAVLIAAFLVVQHFLDRGDPKLREAPFDAVDALQPFTDRST